MYHYTELGEVNTKEMFRKAYEGGYAVPAFNFISIEQFNAIIDAGMDRRSPLILLASPNLHKQLGYEMLARMTQSGIDRIKNSGLDIPVALHLDHGMTFEQCVDAVEFGFSSIMIDGSALPFEENVALTRRTVDYAHRHGVTVEAAIPCEEQAERWRERDRDRYFALVKACDYETMVQHHYDKGCMLRRNRYMVDRSSMLIAAYDGMLGGTMYTLSYAMKKGLEIITLEI